MCEQWRLTMAICILSLLFLPPSLPPFPTYRDGISSKRRDPIPHTLLVQQREDFLFQGTRDEDRALQVGRGLREEGREGGEGERKWRN